MGLTQVRDKRTSGVGDLRARGGVAVSRVHRIILSKLLTPYATATNKQSGPAPSGDRSRHLSTILPRRQQHCMYTTIKRMGESAGVGINAGKVNLSRGGGTSSNGRRARRRISCRANLCPEVSVDVSTRLLRCRARHFWHARSIPSADHSALLRCISRALVACTLRSVADRIWGRIGSPRGVFVWGAAVPVRDSRTSHGWVVHAAVHIVVPVGVDSGELGIAVLAVLARPELAVTGARSVVVGW